MHYTFPDVSNFDAVRRIVLDTRGFTIIRHADHIAFCYAYVDAELFPEVVTWEDATRRELRGLTFDLNGKVISRPYHKFFNLGERPETQPDVIDLSRPHEILEKLDGSMVRPIPPATAIAWGPKRVSRSCRLSLRHSSPRIPRMTPSFATGSAAT